MNWTRILRHELTNVSSLAKAGNRRRNCAALSGLLIAGSGVLTAFLPSLARADGPGRALADLSLEELMNESVTSVSKREQKRSDVASAITVLTNDDLRRSGAMHLADALRLVPGVNVGSVNATSYAVSARGFNNTLANKQLVLVDGRAVYSPLFAGVYWDLQQPMLDDVERIEVIRGPGATVWGANAVNGVISVLSRSARDTQGGLVFAGATSTGGAHGGLRYGGQIGSGTYYRVFASEERVGDFDLANGQDAHDGARLAQGGFRLDHYASNQSQVTWQGDVVRADLQEDRSDAHNFNTLGRWKRELATGSHLEAQIYFDRTHRDESGRIRSTIDTTDLSFQQTLGWGDRHTVIWGGGYRFIDDHIDPVGLLSLLRQSDFTQHLFSAFVQDEIRLVPDRFTLTVGTKLEHNDITGVEFQPSVRAVFKPSARQTLWSAVSRAVRTPNEIESRNSIVVVAAAPSDSPMGLVLPVINGNDQLRSEVLWAYELGYRVQPTPYFNFEIAAFHNEYSRLIGAGATPTYLPGAPFVLAVSPWANVFRGRTHGAEASANFSLSRVWRLSGSYSTVHAHLHSSHATATAIDWTAPKHQFALRSSFDVARFGSVDLQFRAVSGIRDVVPAYHTVDLRFAARLSPHTELAVTGQNLLDPRHPEQPLDQSGLVTSEVPRRFLAKLTWRF
jgi:iron complex outermembrane recepter protein